MDSKTSRQTRITSTINVSGVRFLWLHDVITDTTTQCGSTRADVQLVQHVKQFYEQECEA